MTPTATIMAPPVAGQFPAIDMALVVEAGSTMPEPAELEAAERAALAAEAEVTSVHFAGTSGRGIHLFQGADAARRIAMQTLVGRGVVQPDTQLSLQPVPVITTAEEARALVRSLQNAIDKLRLPLHYNDEPAIPMMVLRQLAQMVSRAEQTQLRGEAAEALAAKDRLVAEAKVLLLLNRFHYEHKALLNRYYHYLDNPSPILFFEHLAETLFFEYQNNNRVLQRQTRQDYEKVVETEQVLHAYSVVLSWAKQFFPDAIGVFGRRLHELGFARRAELTEKIKDQVRQAKRGLVDFISTRR